MKKFKLVSLLIGLVFFFSNINCVQGMSQNGKIHKNVYVQNIDVSNLTKEEAKEALNKIINENNEIILKYDKGSYKINLQQLDVQYMVDDCIEEAYDVGRDDKLLKNIKTKINLDLGKKINIDLKCNYNEEKLQSVIDSINKDLYVSPVNATLKIENNIFITTQEEYGQSLNKVVLKEMIVTELQSILKEEVDLPIESIEPKYKVEQLCKIDTILGTYETYFNPEVENRVENIRLASNATNNILVNTDEEFSFNERILKSDAPKNMKEAPVIINGKLEKGLGGGICQVSSTIYNAALYADMDITSVRNHSIPSAYISKGRDATVSLGDIDFKFKNKFDTPILIYNEVFDNRIVSTIYGNKEDKKDIEVITEVTETLQNKTIEKNSEEFYVGQRVVKQDGRIGYKVKTFRIYKLDNETSKELVYESYYPPMDKIIVNGTRTKKIYKKEYTKPKNQNKLEGKFV